MCNNRIAVVTGANKGLGFAIVKGLCQKFQGTVYLTSRNKEKGKAACKDLENQGLNPLFYQLDVTDPDSITKFCSHLVTENKTIDILVNNAGILFLKDASESLIYQAEETISVNFFSLVNFTESILPLVKDNGTILNISSSSGHLSRLPSDELRNKLSATTLSLEELKNLMSDYVNAVKSNNEIEQGWGESPYVVSKIGVNAYTFMLNRRIAQKGILVNCVHPGYVMSDMTRGAGSVTPEQAAEVPLRLALAPPAGGLYVWHDGSAVPWDGPDPRGYIDGKK